MHPGRRPSRTPLAAAALLAFALVVTACSSGSSDAATKSSSSTTSVDKDMTTDLAETSTTAPKTTTTSPPPEQYSGPDDGFYDVPKPLPAGKPGQLIRVQDLGTKDGVKTLKIMYHSRDAERRDRAVTGLVSYPTTAAPLGGWPVTSYAHGTTGLATQCAPSRGNASPGTWGVDGVHVATDYVGLGPKGEVHPYLSGPSEGNSVIDAVRAARNLPAAHAGTKWFSIGHSQGGHAALFGGERAATYAPELHLVGTVAMAPATELTKTCGDVDALVSRIVSVMALYGAAGEHPAIHPHDYVGPAVTKVEKIFETGCLDQIIPAVAPIPADAFYTHDPRTTDPAKGLLTKESQPGLVITKTPLYLAQGTADERVNIERTKDFFARVCKGGQVTDLQIVKGDDHEAIVGDAAPAAATWMNDLLAGKASPNSCPDS